LELARRVGGAPEALFDGFEEFHGKILPLTVKTQRHQGVNVREVLWDDVKVSSWVTRRHVVMKSSGVLCFLAIGAFRISLSVCTSSKRLESRRSMAFEKFRDAVGRHGVTPCSIA
jgi:hypothetical protein